ncbi:MAG: hypothetical protein QXX51_02485 [Candidatus Bathyarchaeia archaeon]
MRGFWVKKTFKKGILEDDADTSLCIGAVGFAARAVWGDALMGMQYDFEGED